MSNESKALELATAWRNAFTTRAHVDAGNAMAAALERQHVEIESLQRFKAAYEAWSTKTEWFAREAQPQHLGKHIADALRDEVTSLRQQLDNAAIEIARQRAENAELNQQLAQRAPDGCVLVPVEPTVNMAEMGSIASDYDLSQDRCRKVWAAMVRAARKEQK